MPAEQPYLKWNVRHTQRKCHEVREQRHAGVRLKEFLPMRKQRWVQNPLHAWKVNLSVLGIRMIAVGQQGGCRQEQKQGGRRVSSQRWFGG